jgi:hypothetical protein
MEGTSKLSKREKELQQQIANLRKQLKLEKSKREKLAPPKNQTVKLTKRITPKTVEILPSINNEKIDNELTSTKIENKYKYTGDILKEYKFMQGTDLIDGIDNKNWSEFYDNINVKSLPIQRKTKKNLGKPVNDFGIKRMFGLEKIRGKRVSNRQLNNLNQNANFSQSLANLIDTKRRLYNFELFPQVIIDIIINLNDGYAVNLSGEIWREESDIVKEARSHIMDDIISNIRFGDDATVKKYTKILEDKTQKENDDPSFGMVVHLPYFNLTVYNENQLDEWIKGLPSDTKIASWQFNGHKTLTTNRKFDLVKRSEFGLGINSAFTISEYIGEFCYIPTHDFCFIKCFSYLKKLTNVD